MRIMHICLACTFTGGLSYQENILVEENCRDGHEVLVIADCMKFEDGQAVKTDPEDVVLACGARMIRMPYVKVLFPMLSEKIRKVEGLMSIMREFAPNVVMFHGSAGREILTAAQYKKEHPETKLYADVHAISENSARNPLSAYILHKGLYRRWLHKALPYIDKVFYITEDAKDFMTTYYRIPVERAQLLPLGGLLPDDGTYAARRAAKRAELGLGEEDVLLMHSGKMNPEKRTADILAAMREVPDSRLHLAVIGSATEDVRTLLDQAVQDDGRIRYLGWKSSAELLEYFCAADLYLQPGTQSAAMQNAACCRSAIAVYPNFGYTALLGESAFFIETRRDIVELLARVAKEPSLLQAKREASFAIAKEKLDYRKLAALLYQ